MSSSEPGAARARLRREPPRFRQVEVRRVVRVSPRLVRVTLAGAELEGLTVAEPAASVRLLLPPGGVGDLVVPSWNGNEFLMPDGRRPTIRTFTPRRVDEGALELDLDAVVHGDGVASRWAAAAEPGARAAVSGPGRGYTIDRDAPVFVLAGDETAIPAIGQLLEHLPRGTPTEVHIEVARPDARLTLPEHPSATITWHDRPRDAPPGDTLVDAISRAELADDARIWAAGEAAAMQRIRHHLFDERSIPRARTTVRGYWKRGRTGSSE